MNKDGAVTALFAVRFAPFFAAGMLCAYFAPEITIVAGALAAAAVFVPKLKKPLRIRAAAFALGAMIMACYTMFFCKPVLAYGGKTVTADFYITETVRSADSSQYIAAVRLDGIRARVRLNGAGTVSVGDTLTAQVKLSASEDRWRTLDMSRGVLLSGYITKQIEIKPSSFSVLRFVSELRDSIKGQLSQYLGGDEEALALSMMFGDDSRVSAKLYDEIRVSGTAHYTAVSGAHFSVFIALLLWFLPIKRERARSAAALMVMVPAVIFFGASASVIRSAVMLAIYFAAPLFNLRAEPLNTLCAAFVIITTVSPGSVLDVGFWMSVLGVFGASAVGARLGKRLRGKLYERLHGAALRVCERIIDVMCSSVCAVICTAPISISVFGGISLIGALTTVIIMPLFMGAMAAVFLMGALGIPFPVIPAALLLRAMRVIIGFFGSFDGWWLSFDFTGGAVPALICAAAVTLMAFLDEKHLRLCAGITVFSILSALVLCLYMSYTRSCVEFVSDGNDGAAVICCGDKAAVYVCGSGGGLCGRLSDTLRRNGVKTISVFAAPDLSFTGALAAAELSEIFPIEKLCANESTSDVLARDFDGEMLTGSVQSVSAGGITFSTQKAGKEITGDVVLVSGYTLKAPECSARLAVYFSSRQNVLPDRCVNAYDERVRFDAPELGNIVVSFGSNT